MVIKGHEERMEERKKEKKKKKSKKASKQASKPVSKLGGGGGESEFEGKVVECR